MNLEMFFLVLTYYVATIGILPEIGRMNYVTKQYFSLP